MKFVEQHHLIGIFFFLLSLSILSAQPVVEWQKKYGGTNRDRAHAISLTSDGGYIVVGESRSIDVDVFSNQGNFDVLVIKFSETGDLQWTQSYGGSGYDIANDVLLTSDGGYLVSGYTTSSDGDIGLNIGLTDYWLLKLSTNGTLEWEKTYGTVGDDFGRSVIKTNDGGYAFIGSGTKNNTTTDRDVMVIKIAADGTLLWQKFYGGSGTDQARKIKQTSEGGYIIVGSTSSSDGDVGALHGSTDVWVLKISVTGVIEWEETFGGGPGYHNAYDIVEMHQGYVIVAQHGGEDIWLINTEKEGSFVWQNSLGGSDYDYPSAIIEDIDSNFVITGLTRSNDGDVAGNKGLDDCWIIKVDAQGQPIWQKTIGGSSFDMATDIKQTADGGFIVSGFSSSKDGDVTNHIGLQDIWLIKLSAGTVTTDEVTLLQPFKVYPNPTVNTLFIDVLTDQVQTFTISNSVGQVIIKGTLLLGQNSVDVKNFESGYYFIEVEDGESEKFSQTFYKN